MFRGALNKPKMTVGPKGAGITYSSHDINKSSYTSPSVTKTKTTSVDYRTGITNERHSVTEGGRTTVVSDQTSTTPVHIAPSFTDMNTFNSPQIHTKINSPQIYHTERTGSVLSGYSGRVLGGSTTSSGISNVVREGGLLGGAAGVLNTAIGGAAAVLNTATGSYMGGSVGGSGGVVLEGNPHLRHDLSQKQTTTREYVEHIDDVHVGERIVHHDAFLTDKEPQRFLDSQRDGCIYSAVGSPSTTSRTSNVTSPSVSHVTSTMNRRRPGTPSAHLTRQRSRSIQPTIIQQDTGLKSALEHRLYDTGPVVSPQVIQRQHSQMSRRGMQGLSAEGLLLNPGSAEQVSQSSQRYVNGQLVEDCEYLREDGIVLKDTYHGRPRSLSRGLSGQLLTGSVGSGISGNMTRAVSGSLIGVGGLTRGVSAQGLHAMGSSRRATSQSPVLMPQGSTEHISKSSQRYVNGQLVEDKEYIREDGRVVKDTYGNSSHGFSRPIVGDAFLQQQGTAEWFSN